MIKVILLILFLFYPAIQSQEFNSIELIDKTKLDSIVTNRYGRSLLINVWATWCLPCKEEMPDLNKVTASYSETVDVIGISIDFPDEIIGKVVPFVKVNDLNFRIYVNNFEKDEDLINYFESSWSGALPATFIYDKSGSFLEFIEGKSNYSEFSEILNKTK